jgi:hypothetical protein
MHNTIGDEFVFTHGQLPVTFSRVKNFHNVKIYRQIFKQSYVEINSEVRPPCP